MKRGGSRVLSVVKRFVMLDERNLIDQKICYNELNMERSKLGSDLRAVGLFR